METRVALVTQPPLTTTNGQDTAREDGKVMPQDTKAEDDTEPDAATVPEEQQVQKTVPAPKSAALRVVRAKGLVWIANQQNHWLQVRARTLHDDNIRSSEAERLLGRFMHVERCCPFVSCTLLKFPLL